MTYKQLNKSIYVISIKRVRVSSHCYNYDGFVRKTGMMDTVFAGPVPPGSHLRVRSEERGLRVPVRRHLQLLRVRGQLGLHPLSPLVHPVRLRHHQETRLCPLGYRGMSVLTTSL